MIMMPTKARRPNPFDTAPHTRGRRAVVRASALRDVVLATVEGLVGAFDDYKNLMTVGARPGGAMTIEVVQLVLDQQLARLEDRSLARAVVEDRRVYEHLCAAVRGLGRAARGARQARRDRPGGIDAIDSAKRGLAKPATRDTTAWMAELHAGARLIFAVAAEPKAFQGELDRYRRSESWKSGLTPSQHSTDRLLHHLR
jgi:hypothetical protein